MRLFHGSNTAVEIVDFDKCKPYKDFGRGFYLTEIEQQAVLMAKRTASIHGGVPVVSKFEFDESAFDDPVLSIKHFHQPDREWALFVMKNRSREHIQPVHGHDIVIGPVADDDIAVLFRNFADGIIDLPTLVMGLRYKKVSSQYFFHSPAAATYLKAI